MNVPLRLRQLPPSYLAAAIWLAVFLAAVLTGESVRVDDLYNSWHVLPLEPLREHTLQSLWNLHTHPPLWNALVGVAEWVGPSFTFYVVMSVSGAVLAWAVAELATIAGASARAAIVLALFSTLSGRLFSFAFVASYELPVAALLAVTVLLAARRTVPWPMALAGLAVVLLRAMFHPLWFVLLVALWWWLHRRVVPWRQVILTSLLSLALLGGLMVKNEVKFGMFTLASWYGMHQLRSVQAAVGQDRLDALVADGTISPVGALNTFSSYDVYAPVMPPCLAGNGPAVLEEPWKGEAMSPSKNRSELVPNYNYHCFLPVYQQAGADTLAIIGAEPGAWIKARLWATNNWFGMPPKKFESPVTRSLLIISNVTLLAVPHPGLPDAWSQSGMWVHEFPQSIVLMVLTFVVLWSGLRSLWWQPQEAELPGARRVALVLSAMVVAWSMAISIIAELGEQERLRLMTDPLVLSMGGALVWTWWCGRGVRLPRPSTPNQSVALSAVVLVLGLGVVALGDGNDTGVLLERPTTILTRPATLVVNETDPKSLPRCDHVVHLGDSNLGMAAAMYREEYAERGIDAVIDFENGRGAFIAHGNGAAAVDAIAMWRSSLTANGRCWVIALSSADAVAAKRGGSDPTGLILAIADAVDGEPVLWVTPVLASTKTERTLEASMAYNAALFTVADERPNIEVLDWQDIALDHLDQFLHDGTHYKRELYELQVQTVFARIDRVWDTGR